MSSSGGSSVDTRGILGTMPVFAEAVFRAIFPRWNNAWWGKGGANG